jgi:hypothetical protein
MISIADLIDNRITHSAGADPVRDEAKERIIGHIEAVQSALLDVSESDNRGEQWVMKSLSSLTLEATMGLADNPAASIETRRKIKQGLNELPGFDPGLRHCEQPREVLRHYGYGIALLRYALETE